MDYEVVKPFKTLNRRFAPGPGPGGVVTTADGVSPHTIDSLVAKEFIGSKVIAMAPVASTSPDLLSKPARATRGENVDK